MRKAFWLAAALLPVWMGLAIFELHDVPVWKHLLSAGVPAAIVDGLRSQAWWIFVGLVAAHYGFFILHPLFNRTFGSWLAKCAWSVATVLLYPIVPPVYALLCTGRPPHVPTPALRRRR